MELTREEALELHRQMWTDMQKYLGDCPDCCYKTEDIDKEKCIASFGKQYNKEKALITWIKANKIRILNSGIKVA